MASAADDPDEVDGSVGSPELDSDNIQFGPSESIPKLVKAALSDEPRFQASDWPFTDFSVNDFPPVNVRGEPTIAMLNEKRDLVYDQSDIYRKSRKGGILSQSNLQFEHPLRQIYRKVPIAVRSNSNASFYPRPSEFIAAIYGGNPNSDTIHVELPTIPMFHPHGNVQVKDCALRKGVLYETTVPFMNAPSDLRLHVFNKAKKLVEKMTWMEAWTTLIECVVTGEEAWISFLLFGMFCRECKMENASKLFRVWRSGSVLSADSFVQISHLVSGEISAPESFDFIFYRIVICGSFLHLQQFIKYLRCFNGTKYFQMSNHVPFPFVDIKYTDCAVPPVIIMALMGFLFQVVENKYTVHDEEVFLKLRLLLESGILNNKDGSTAHKCTVPEHCRCTDPYSVCCKWFLMFSFLFYDRDVPDSVRFYLLSHCFSVMVGKDPVAQFGTFKEFVAVKCCYNLPILEAFEDVFQYTRAEIALLAPFGELSLIDKRYELGTVFGRCSFETPKQLQQAFPPLTQDCYNAHQAMLLFSSLWSPTGPLPLKSGFTKYDSLYVEVSPNVFLRPVEIVVLYQWAHYLVQPFFNAMLIIHSRSSSQLSHPVWILLKRLAAEIFPDCISVQDDGFGPLVLPQPDGGPDKDGGPPYGMFIDSLVAAVKQKLLPFILVLMESYSKTKTGQLVLDTVVPLCAIKQKLKKKKKPVVTPPVALETIHEVVELAPVVDPRFKKPSIRNVQVSDGTDPPMVCTVFAGWPNDTQFGEPLRGSYPRNVVGPEPDYDNMNDKELKDFFGDDNWD